jgi:hypothetical protein
LRLKGGTPPGEEENELLKMRRSYTAMVAEGRKLLEEEINKVAAITAECAAQKQELMTARRKATIRSPSRCCGKTKSADRRVSAAFAARRKAQVGRRPSAGEVPFRKTWPGEKQKTRSAVRTWKW